MKKKLNRRKFLKWMGISAATVSAGTLLYSDCAVCGESNVISGKTGTRCPHRFCRRYQPPEGEVNENAYNIFTDEEGYCTSKAFDSLPRIQI